MNERRATTSNGQLAKLSQLCVVDSKRWFGDSEVYQSIPHHTLAMCGEVGEFANLIKKIERGSLNLKDAKVRVDVASELTDVLVYLLNIAGLLGIDLDVTFDAVRTNNERRFTLQRNEREGKK